MQNKVLLLGCDRTNGLHIAKLIIDSGHTPTADDWSEFSPRTYPRAKRPKLILANCDNPNAKNFEEFCTRVRKAWGHDFPIIALSESRKFGRAADLVDAGANTCLRPDAPEALIIRNINASLEGKYATSINELTEEIPGSLLGLFMGNNNLIRLGDIANVYPGVAPRSTWSRRTAPPDQAWQKVVTADTLGKFHIGPASTYLLWSKLHLFRLPALEEYSVPEKVIMSRVGPPITAAVDKARLPAGADAYSIVPKENAGVGAGFIAGILNSRLMDFYFNRLVSVLDSRLRTDDIRNTPVPAPSNKVNREFDRMATLLAHFGPNPESWIDRQSRDEIRESMEDAVFHAYGAGTHTQKDLAELHF